MYIVVTLRHPEYPLTGDRDSCRLIGMNMMRDVNWSVLTEMELCDLAARVAQERDARQYPVGTLVVYVGTTERGMHVMTGHLAVVVEPPTNADNLVVCWDRRVATSQMNGSYPRHYFRPASVEDTVAYRLRQAFDPGELVVLVDARGLDDDLDTLTRPVLATVRHLTPSHVTTTTVTFCDPQVAQRIPPGRLDKARFVALAHYLGREAD